MTQQCIIQVLPALQQGGVERGTVEIAAALQAAGIRNYVVSNGGKMVPELTALGVEHIQMPVHTKNPILILINAIRLARLFRRLGATLIHVRSRAPAWSVRWACCWTKIPFVATYHGRYGTHPAWLKKPYNRVMLKGKKVIAVSEFVKKHLQDEYGVSDEHIRLIHRGADIDRFNPDTLSPDQVQALADAHDVPRDKPIITLVGRLSRMKGHTVFLQALQQMRHKKITVLFVGGNPKGDYETELQTLLDALPKETTVRLFGVSGDEIPVVYALSDICVQPSLIPETFGRTMAEAQAMGKVVVAFAHGGACELIQDGQTGFLTPVGDAAALAKTLDRVLDMSPADRTALGQRAQRSVREHFPIRKMCERTLALYQELATEQKH